MRLTLPLIVFALGIATVSLAEEKPPNIVFLLTDDHPFDQYGFMGSEVAHTPHIDKLASQSARY